jgi:hypothetical protein
VKINGQDFPARDRDDGLHRDDDRRMRHLWDDEPGRDNR